MRYLIPAVKGARTANRSVRPSQTTENSRFTRRSAGPSGTTETLIIAVLVTCLSTVASDAAERTAIAPIVAARLALMPEVAKAKWNARRPVEDLAREAQLIATLTADVPETSRARAERAIRAQIEASKQVQKDLFAQWNAHKQEPFRRVRDLDAELRPAIGRLTSRLIEAIVNGCETDTPTEDPVARRHRSAFETALRGVECDPAQ